MMMSVWHVWCRVSDRQIQMPRLKMPFVSKTRCVGDTMQIYNELLCQISGYESVFATPHGIVYSPYVPLCASLYASVWRIPVYFTDVNGTQHGHRVVIGRAPRQWPQTG